MAKDLGLCRIVKEFMSCFHSHHYEVVVISVFLYRCVNTVNLGLIPIKPTRLTTRLNNDNDNNNNDNNKNNNKVK